MSAWTKYSVRFTRLWSWPPPGYFWPQGQLQQCGPWNVISSSSQMLIYLGPGKDSASVLGRILCCVETSTLAAGQKAGPPSAFCATRGGWQLVAGPNCPALDFPELGPQLEFWWPGELGSNLSSPRKLWAFFLFCFPRAVTKTPGLSWFLLPSHLTIVCSKRPSSCPFPCLCSQTRADAQLSWIPGPITVASYYSPTTGPPCLLLQC